MTTINQHCRKFQELLRELFQFDCADLDFGIYRIMNYKRDVLEKFISEDLPGFVGKELDSGDLAEQSEIADELEEVTGQIREALGPDAIGYDGNLADVYNETPLGRKYRKIKARATGVRSREALESAIFNNLYAFFRRYYQDGDFISKRRYSKRQRYAVPYNGEEFLLHWANKDQYYIKSAEHFHDYSFTSHGVTVHFKLESASVEQNNVKGDKRFFLPLPNKIEVNPKQVVIPFEYRPLNKPEENLYGSKNQQAFIIAEALTEVPKRLNKNEGALLALVAERRKTKDGKSVTFLEHHLQQYTRRNTSDFFIHKDLKGFLSRELDFYLKSEVLNLDEMETAGENRAEGWFQTMRLIKIVGSKIIDFLDQIERFQKMLWEKRKFVMETQYCITVGMIEESFYDEIATCESQWMEWKELFPIGEEEIDLFNSRKDKNGRRIAFLKAHPNLVLDTKHFNIGFVDLLLDSLDDLDEMIDGLIVNSENWQALNLLIGKYREKIRCIYIDPPYNTGNDEFIYKDSYQHSSWLSMMGDRIALSKALLAVNGSHYCQIDTNENYRLGLLIDTIFEFQREIIWDTQVLSGFKTVAKNWIRGHETILYHTKTGDYLFNKQRQPHRKEYLDRFDKQDEDGRWYFDGRGTKLYKDEVVRKGKAVGDVWYDIMSFQQQPTSKERVNFYTQKPEKLIERIILASTNESDWVLDCFLGSGTTCAVALMLGRKAVGVEMGQQFSDVVLPRLKRLLYDQSTAVPHKERYKGGGAFKYVFLESYEDSLNNIEYESSPGQRALEFEDYLLRYMLKWETRTSKTFLNTKKLSLPFHYKLCIHSNGQTSEKTADIPETFNYLMGVHVQKRRVYYDDGRRYLVYRGLIDNRRVAIVWRETEGWKQADLERDKKFVAEKELVEGAEEIFVNGDSFIPNAKSLEPEFKSRMFAPVET